MNLGGCFATLMTSEGILSSYCHPAFLLGKRPLLTQCHTSTQSASNMDQHLLPRSGSRIYKRPEKSEITVVVSKTVIFIVRISVKYTAQQQLWETGKSAVADKPRDSFYNLEVFLRQTSKDGQNHGVGVHFIRRYSLHIKLPPRFLVWPWMTLSAVEVWRECRLCIDYLPTHNYLHYNNWLSVRDYQCCAVTKNRFCLVLFMKHSVTASYLEQSLFSIPESNMWTAPQG